MIIIRLAEKHNVCPNFLTPKVDNVTLNYHTLVSVGMLSIHPSVRPPNPQGLAFRMAIFSDRLERCMKYLIVRLFGCVFKFFWLFVVSVLNRCYPIHK